MTDESQSAVIGELTTRISIKLDEAAGIARAAHRLKSQGLPERLFRTRLDVEPLFADASILLNAAPLICRGADDTG